MIPPKTTTDDVTFIKQVPVYPRDPKKFILKRKSKNVKPIYPPDKTKRKVLRIAAETAETLFKGKFNFSPKNIKQDQSFRYISCRRRESHG